MNDQPFSHHQQAPFAIIRFCQKYGSVFLLTIFFLWLFASAAFAQSCPRYPSPHLRVGFNLARDGGVQISDYDTLRLGAGWYHDYGFNQTSAHPGGILYHQMVRGNGRTTPEHIQSLLNMLAPVVAANPGQLWTVGNEPDRYGQDQLTPTEYAVFYHHVYTFIKAHDPSSRIAVGGIMQPSPIRLRYLDQMLAIYQQTYNQPLPADLWHVHNFILPENCSWGGGIPPGLDAYRNEGIPCPATLNDHGDLNIFKQQLHSFRQWMNNRGYRNYPLIVSEYGILLSKYHGFTHPRVRDFMLGSFDFMLNTVDSGTGYPADSNRLVQEFAWFSLNYYEFNLETYTGLNGNLFDHGSRQIMPLGLDFENYLKTITVKQSDLALYTVGHEPVQPQANLPVTLTARFANHGSVTAQGVAVRFWNGDPRRGGQLIGSAPSLAQLLPECAVPKQATFLWTPTQPGSYTLFADLTAADGNPESNVNNNYASVTFTVVNDAITPMPTPTATPTATPVVQPTITPSAMPTTTPTPTQTNTALPSVTPTLLVTATAGATASPTAAATSTATPTATLIAPSSTPTPTNTPAVVGNAPVALDIALPSAQVTAGDAIRYRFRYNNVSNQAVTNLILRLQVPHHTTFDAQESSAAWQCTAATPQANCHFTAGDLPVGSTGSVDFVLISEAGLTHPYVAPLSVVVEGDQQIITTAYIEVTIHNQRVFFQYLPAIQHK